MCGMMKYPQGHLNALTPQKLGRLADKDGSFCILQFLEFFTSKWE